MALRAASVFLNVPFDHSYERFFIGLIASVVAVGRTPRCVLELTEYGSGRLTRLIHHIGSCSLSIHDLSRVGTPARFNMPFELGLAVAKDRTSKKHAYMILETTPYRLDKTLSDIKGRDPIIYNSSVKLLIASVAGALQPALRDAVDIAAVYDVYRKLRKITPALVQRKATRTIFTRSVYRELVTAATIYAADNGLIRE